MIEKLPETDLIKIQDLIRQLFQQHEPADNAVGKTLKRMSREDFLRDVADAERDIAEGRYRAVDEVFDGLEQRYGF